jgi:beta-lactamase superfamily II metal-dependent hydrolase
MPIIGNIRFKFHPIGQGLFYSSEIEFNGNRFNFVYDCGAETSKDRLRKEIDFFVKNLPNEKSKFLDLLVISHFHDDHINGLPDLLKKVYVDTVILPYLSPVERLLYLAMNRKPLQEYHEFVLDPIGFLLTKNVGKVIVIGRGTEGDKYDDFNPPNEPLGEQYETNFDISKLGSQQGDEIVKGFLKADGYGEYIADGRLIPKSHEGYALALGIYLFRFFNVKENLKKEIKCFEECILYEFQKSSVICLLNNYKDLLIEDIKTLNKSKLRQCYEKVFGKQKLNLTSLILYNQLLSPFYLYLEINSMRCCNLSPICCYWYNKHPFGNFLTGDAELKKEKIFDEFKKHYEKVLENSFFFLLPHHGSKNNWNRNLLGEIPNNIFYIASAGIKNRHRHPSFTVFKEIQRYARIPIWVNELCSFSGEILFSIPNHFIIKKFSHKPIP